MLTIPASPVSAASAPDAPVITRDVTTTSSVRVAWTAPANGGSPITRFELRRGATLVSASISATSTSYNNTGLSSGTEYSFTLKACNAIGCSDASTALTAATLPVAPTLVTGAAGVGEVSVSWTNSTSTTVTGHKVFFKTAAALTWSEWTPGVADTSPTVVTGLTNAVPYVFKVAAYNDSGSTESRPTANITPRTVPSAPTITLSTTGLTGITFTWVAPAANGSAITSYKVYKDGVLASTLGTSTRFTANGLTAGTEYAFTVQACNVAGCSVDSNTLTVPTKPASTTLILGTPGNQQISVNWTASASPVVTGYNLFYKTSSALTWTEWTPGELDVSPVTVTGLTNGTAYVFKVASVNSSGNTESRSSSAITPRTLPSAPVLIPGTATFATLAYTWAEPANGGNKITGYQVYVNNTIHSTVTSGRLTLSGLTAATEYDVKVRACNAAGCGAWSTTHEAVTKATAVTVTVTPADSSAQLVWTNASGVVDAHKVYYKLATSVTWTEWTPGESDTSPTTVTGLTNGLSYNFKVAAVNNAGATDSSSISKTPLGVPPTAPAQPTASTATTSGATIAWTAPSNTGGISASGYQIWVNGLLVSTTTSSARSYVITGQSPAETHSAQVKVCNTAGCSPASTARSFNTLPVAATSLAITPATLTASVSWTDSTGSLVTAHNLYYKQASSATWTEWTPGTADTSPVTVTGLSASTQYQFKIATVASSGSTETATVSSTTLTGTAPSAPLNALADGGNQQVQLTWNVPASDGGSPITGYPIRQFISGTWTTITTVSPDAVAKGSASYMVTGLTNGTYYSFMIGAENAIGVTWTSGELVAQPRSIPGEPVNLTVTSSGNQKVYLTWQAPTSDGGSSVTGYMVEYHDGDANWEVYATENADVIAGFPGSPYAVSGLTGGLTYSFRVSAFNTVGYSAVSDTVNGYPYTTPGAPIGVTATAGNGSILVSWNKPSDGGSNIISYTATAEPGGATCTALAPDTTCGITGLTAGTEYTVTVTALNAAGAGPASSTGLSSVATPYTTPGAPTGLDTFVNAQTTGQVSLSWNTPSSDGSSPVTGYLVEYHDGDATWEFLATTNSNSYTTTSLLMATTYYFRVTAENAAGYGAVSNEASANTYAYPSAPTGLTVTRETTTATFSWTAPANDGGYPVTSYIVSVNNGSSCVTAGLSCTVTDLTANTTYTASVTALTTVGESGASSSVSFTTKIVAPARTTSWQVDSATLYQRNGWLWIKADTNVSNVDTAISDLNSLTANSEDVWQISVDGAAFSCVPLGSNPSCESASNQIYSGNSFPYNNTSLFPGSIMIWEYAGYNSLISPICSTYSGGSPSNSFTLQLRNPSGEYTNVFNVSCDTKTVVAPNAATSLNTTVGNQTVDLSWAAPAYNGGATITDYIVEYSSNSGSTWSVFDDGVSTATSAAITGLTNSTTYSFRVSAVNSAGTGAASATAAATPNAPPTISYTSGVFSASGTSETVTPVVTNSPTTYSYSGTLPAGVTFNTNTGAFTGPSSWGVTVTALSSAMHTGCAVVSGAAKCWGANTTSTPSLVTGLNSGVTAIATYAVVSGSVLVTSCAVHNGAAKCWGDNSSGQIGDGTTTNRTTPVTVSGLTSGVTSISRAGLHTCAVHNGAAKCWGSNANGQLGDNTTTNRLTPVTVSGLTSGVTAVATSESGSSCALLDNGSVRCWGSNTYGQLGDNTTTNRLTPVTVSGLTSGVTAVAMGYAHACATLLIGTLMCWGENGMGQVGDGTTTSRLTPVTATGLPANVTAVSAGLARTCVVLTTGGVYCWGYGSAGGLGNGGTANSVTPVQVSGLESNGIAVSSGGWYHSCALITTGVKCWGARQIANLGDGVAGGDYALTPVSPLALNQAAGTPAVITVTATNSGGSSSTTVTLSVS